MGETQSRQDYDTQQQCARAEKYKSKKAHKTRRQRSGKRRHRRKSTSQSSASSSSSDVYETRHKRSDSGSSLFSETSSVYSTSSSVYSTSSAESDYDKELLAKRQQACLSLQQSEKKQLTKTFSLSSFSSLSSSSSSSSDASTSSLDEVDSLSASGESKQDQPVKTSQGCGQIDSSTCSENLPNRFISDNFQACSPDFITCCKNVATFLSEAAAKNGSNDNKCAPPNAEYIYCYMRLLFDILQLPAECCVIADIYFRRLLTNTKGTLKIHSGNWQRILVGSCLLASKYLDDESVENADFSFILTGCSLEFMNKLECKFIQLLNWRLYVPLEEYTERCTQLGSKPDCNVDWNVDFIKVKPHFTVRSRNIEIN